MVFFHKKKTIQKLESEEKKDESLFIPFYDLNDKYFELCFENGITVILRNHPIFMKFHVFTPRKEITNRFGSGFVSSSESLLKLLNFVAMLPNTYTVEEIPDSCFNPDKS